MRRLLVESQLAANNESLATETTMIEVPVYNQAGSKVDTFQLDEAKLGGEVRKSLLKPAARRKS